MFGIGFTELVVVMVLALLVFGPEKIPTIARTLARVYREVRTTSAEFTQILREDVKDVERDVKDLTRLADLDDAGETHATGVAASQGKVQRDAPRMLDWESTFSETRNEEPDA